MTNEILRLPRRAPADRERWYRVFAIKSDGRRTLFQQYATRQEAEETVAALARMKCPAEVTGPDDDDPMPRAA